MSRIIKFFSILCIGILFPTSLFAAGLDLVKITTNPVTPGPHQEVTVSIQSFAVDLNTAQIIWYVDKEPAKQGIAEKSITTMTGDFGDKTVVDITIIPTYGDTLNKQIVIEPSEVDLLWEARTYTPPFYKGKALPTFKSMVKVTAMPRRNSYSSNPKEFYYKWTYNRIQGLGEALGMNSVLMPSGWPDSAVPISVEVSVPGSTWKGTQEANIPATLPKIVFYEQAPLLGTRFDHAIQNSSTQTGNMLDIRAVPYFFSTDNYLNGNLIYTWNVNGSNTQGGSEPTNLQLTKSGKDAESFAVSLRIQNPKRILQEGKVSSNITLPAEE